MKIRTVIIDDEKLARSRLRRMLAKYDNIDIAGEAQNGQEGIELIHVNHPDLIFLDIKMPLLSGFEMLSRLQQSPYIIFTTAYDQYALQAFEENTVDYLLKPISEEKLDRALKKANMILQQNHFLTPDLERLITCIKKKENIIKRFSVRPGDRIFLIPDHEIYYFYTEDKYTFLNTAKNNYIIPFTLKQLERRLDPELFCRVHRSYIVNIEKISSIHRWFAGKLQLNMKNGKQIVTGARYVNGFKRQIHL